MSKLKTKWLWIVVGVEMAAIAGLLIWGLAMRQPETPTPITPQIEQKTVYRTPTIELTQAVSGLTEPVAIVSMPSKTDERLFVVEQSGAIRIVAADKTLDPTPFLDIKNKVKAGGELGLLGLAFHPKVATNNYFFVNYTDKDLNTIIARYSISKDTGRADPASEKVLLKIKQPFANHNGGDLAFGSDGNLYIGLGDGGSGGDPENRAQNKDEFLGKILRINVNGDGYTIPASNPFAKSGGKPEIWALGLRNPWRFSFDRKTGDLYIADVGQGDYEEINLQKRAATGGANYGWRCYEGLHEFKKDGCKDANQYVQPIIEYAHSEGRCSVTGGYVYRGSKYPALDGKYFYGDYCGGQLYFVEQTSGSLAPVLAADTSYMLSTFGQGSDGELYLADYATGTIYQITDSANPAQ